LDVACRDSSEEVGLSMCIVILKGDVNDCPFFWLLASLRENEGKYVWMMQGESLSHQRHPNHLTAVGNGNLYIVDPSEVIWASVLRQPAST
jgi:hypothetical protein